MKRKLFLTIIFSAIAINCYAASLKWGMQLEKFEKKYNTEERLDTEYFSIVFLPKNSAYKNAFDEYLLFGICPPYTYDNSKVLIRRLQVTDLNETDCKELVKKLEKIDEGDYWQEKAVENELNIKGIGYEQINSLEEIFNYSEKLPSTNSAAIYFLLKTKPYNFYVQDQSGYEKKLIASVMLLSMFPSMEQYTGILCGNTNYILYELDIDKTYSFYEIAYPLCKEIFINFGNYIRKCKTKDLNSSENPGPFGTFWGMSKDNLYLIVKEKTLTPTRESVDIFNEYYSTFSRAGTTTIKKFVPKKSSDAISDYYAIFDDEKGLYQIFTIVNHSYTVNIENMYNNREKNEKDFIEMKKILIEQYGKPTETSKDSVYWVADNDIKIELFMKSKSVMGYDYYHSGKVFGEQEDYTCLVYTDIKKYNVLLDSEKDLIQEEEEEKGKRAKKSFF